MFDKFAYDAFIRSLDKIVYGSLEVISPNENKQLFHGKQAGPKAQIKIYDYCVITNLAVKGDIGFAEDYRDGKWDSEELTTLIYVALKNAEVLDQYIYGNIFHKLLSKLVYFFRSNTLKGSKKNIHAHYDLGNDFYALWLDQSMTYSSAIFSHDQEDLTQAQYNKYDRILARIGEESCNILEIGCGWGGFAERAIRLKDHRIKGITLSQQQYNFAQNRLYDYKKNATIAVEDYRNQAGKFDYIVSIEMFEAVGEKFWPTYFSKISSLLKSKGKAVVQTITIDQKYFDAYRKGGDLIRSFIFPGGMLPSQERFIHEARKAGLIVSDVFHFGISYAKTLGFWLKAFDEKVSKIKALGFDERFIRIWRLYLASCSASFATNRTSVMQIELQHI